MIQRFIETIENMDEQQFVGSALAVGVAIFAVICLAMVLLEHV